MTQVFLSHSTHDAEFALRLASDLREVGVPVWKAPESILEGERWVQAITRGVTTSTHLLILLSPDSVESGWVNFEFEMALPRCMRGQMKIIPLEYLPCEPPASWAVFQYFRGLDRDYDKALLRLIKRVNREQPADPPAPTLPTTTINIAVHDATYAAQPDAPPSSPALVLHLKPLIDRLTAAEPFGLPEPFEWCEISAGLVVIQRKAWTYEYEIQPYLMAKYPITYEQFQVFVDDPLGFRNAEWWEGLAVSDDHRKSPGRQYFTHAKNLPRDSVSWYDAVVFCRWLSARTGLDTHMPDEWEWQWAAQGPDEREYPWGPDYIQGYANINEVVSQIPGGVYVEHTTPVDSYPQGASPYGVLDMSGNVWEWCGNKYHTPTDTDLTGRALRTLRGGSWHGNLDVARVSYRGRFNPNLRSNYLGFRVACSYLEE